MLLNAGYPQISRFFEFNCAEQYTEIFNMKNILILSLSILLSAIVPAAGFDQGRTNKLMAEHRKQALDLDVIAEQSTLASPEKIPLEIERKFLIDQNSIPQNFL